MAKNKDPQGRKWNITINNPDNDGFTRERIKEILQSLKSVVYWCICNEIGAEGQTPHAHLYIHCSSAVRFSTLKNLFPTAHLERAGGTAQENKDYIAKTGKWADTEKADTNVEGSFEEWGEIPLERGGKWNVEAAILDRIQDGATNAEILLEFGYLRGLRDVENARQTIRHEEYRNKWRDLEIVYIWGDTGTGKTRSVMDEHGYSNVYAVNNYKYPFDGYFGENVMLFDEFDSSIRIQDMNNYLDGYPIALPARYSNKQACYEKVFIISNLDLLEQYKSVQINEPKVWRAFLRRIQKVIRFYADGTRREYRTEDYLAYNKSYNSVWVELPADTPTPFDVEETSPKKAVEIEQLPLSKI